MFTTGGERQFILRIQKETNAKYLQQVNVIPTAGPFSRELNLHQEVTGGTRGRAPRLTHGRGTTGHQTPVMFFRQSEAGLEIKNLHLL